ncbi:MAG: RNA polymerase sigma factor [Deltaproteobacteria bacterium]|nr:RNA polymerase sigma factor [Deltaproteobacteria bacterium]
MTSEAADTRSAKSLAAAVERTFPLVYNFLYRLMLRRDDAAAATEETYLRAYVGQEKLPAAEEDANAWLLRIASHVAEQRLAKGGHQITFQQLDETLRSEATRTDVAGALPTPERDSLLWELKQGCMTSVVNCLSVGEREAFVLSVVLGLPDDRAARSLGIKTSAYKVRLSRARQKVNDYLAPRCEHVDPDNPCHCPSRLGVALRRGFIRPPAAAEARLRPPAPFGRYGGDEPLRDVMAIYQSLPDPDPPPELLHQLLHAITAGTWEAVRREKR